VIINAKTASTSFFIAIFLQERGGGFAERPNRWPGPEGFPFLLDFERPDCFQKNVSDSRRESFRPAA